ncbi:hypothetical protein [Nostoc sp.]|uniref:hypothetical protein n=1 Tax=Nostoc sp. TaxID=1180 RepID=UPI003FA54F64
MADTSADEKAPHAKRQYICSHDDRRISTSVTGAGVSWRYNYPQLPDAARWFQAWRFRQVGSTPPPDAVERAIAFPNFHLHLSAPWKSAQEKGGRIVVQVKNDVFEFDFAIAGTGYFVDPTKRPELADFAQHIALWRDRYEPPANQRDDDLGTHPYLGSAHEYLEKVPGTAPYLKDIHIFNPAGFVSFGLPIGDVPSIRRNLPVKSLQFGRVGCDRSRELKGGI